MIKDAISKFDYQIILEYFRKIINGSKYENHVFAVGGCERDYMIRKTIKQGKQN